MACFDVLNEVFSSLFLNHESDLLSQLKLPVVCQVFGSFEFLLIVNRSEVLEPAVHSEGVVDFSLSLRDCPSPFMLRTKNFWIHWLLNRLENAGSGFRILTHSEICWDSRSLIFSLWCFMVRFWRIGSIYGIPLWLCFPFLTILSCSSLS